MDRALTAEEIASAIGLPVRQVRYVLEHRVLPGTEKRSKGHRVTRTFTPFEAFGIAFAASLLGADLRRPLVTKLMKFLTTNIPNMGQTYIPLMKAFHSSASCHIEIGDAQNIRVTGDRPANLSWRQISTGAELADYEPQVRISVNAGRLRDKIEQITRS